MLSDEYIKATSLFKLHKRSNRRRSHTALDNLKKGCKNKDLGKHGVKRVEKLAKELIGAYSLKADQLWIANEAIIEFMKRFFPEV